jgi:hypothetical protein
MSTNKNYFDAEVKCNLDKEKTKNQIISAVNSFFSNNVENSAKRATALADIRFSFYSIRNGRHHSSKVIDLDRADSLVRYLIATTIKECIEREESIPDFIEENDMKLGEAWDILSMLLDTSLNGLGDELLTNLETRDSELSHTAGVESRRATTIFSTVSAKRMDPLCRLLPRILGKVQSVEWFSSIDYGQDT